MLVKNVETCRDRYVIKKTRDGKIEVVDLWRTEGVKFLFQTRLFRGRLIIYPYRAYVELGKR